MAKKKSTSKARGRRVRKQARNVEVIPSIPPPDSYQYAFVNWAQIASGAGGHTLSLRLGRMPDITAQELVDYKKGKSLAVKPIIKVEMPIEIARRLRGILEIAINEQEQAAADKG